MILRSSMIAALHFVPQKYDSGLLITRNLVCISFPFIHCFLCPQQWSQYQVLPLWETMTTWAKSLLPLHKLCRKNERNMLLTVLIIIITVITRFIYSYSLQDTLTYRNWTLQRVQGICSCFIASKGREETLIPIFKSPQWPATNFYSFEWFCFTVLIKWWSTVKSQI